MSVYLIESYNSSVKLKKDDTIVALNPTVCYQLDKENIEYSTIEDYYDEKELKKIEDKYRQFQIKWINNLDIFLQKNIKNLKKHNLKMGSIYSRIIRKRIMDGLFFRCYQLLSFYDKIRPKNIFFLTDKGKKEHSDYTFVNEETSLFSRLIPIICKEKKIDLNTIDVTDDFLYIGKEEYCKRKSDDIIKENLSKMKFLRKLYFFKTYGKDILFKKKSDNKLNILLLKTAHNGFEIIKDSLARNHNIFLLKDDRILKYSIFGEETYCELDDKYKKEIVITQETIQKFKNNFLIKQFNDQCKLDVSEIFIPKIEYFVSEIIPELFNFYMLFIDFYDREQIDFVIIPNRSKLTHFSAIAASNNAEHTYSVGIDHGHDALIKKDWHNCEMKTYDIYICYDEEIKNHLQEICNKERYNTIIEISSHKFSDIQPLKKVSSTQKKNFNKKSKIIYVAYLVDGDYQNIGYNKYSEIWYYFFQKKLIEFFSTKNDFIFIWKGRPVSDHVYNPIPNFIEDKNFSNVRFAMSPFKKYLKLSDRVICDDPSTSFYESTLSGIPTLSLCHKNFKIRETAIKHFQKQLQFFSKKDEAITIINDFLIDKPCRYVKSVNTRYKSIVEILEEKSDLEYKHDRN